MFGGKRIGTVVRALAMAAAVWAGGATDAWAGELSGSVSFETRYFPESPLDPEQFSGFNFSIAIEPEYYVQWDGGDQRIVFAPFLRIDQNDRQRTHFDLREFYYEKYARRFEFRVGFRQLFWGVTESQHLIDNINQIDQVENVDGEDKLGQPMAELAVITRLGVFTGVLMPYFRERTFPGRRGRLRTIPRVDVDQPSFESSAENTHLDWALRWSHSIRFLDLGVSHIEGTSRQPRFVFGATSDGEAVLLPNYPLMSQTMFDVQAALGAWLWKLEWATTNIDNSRFTAYTAGFEYTLVGLFGSVYDVGLLGEYLFDDRNDNTIVPFQNDVFAGARFLFNDVQDTQILGGAIFDLDTQTTMSFIEGSRRVGNRWRVDLEWRGFNNVAADDVLYFLRRDSFIQFTVARFF